MPDRKFRLTCPFLVVYVIGLGVLFGIGVWWSQALSPPIQTTLAVGQLADSDAAHVALRTYEQGRNTMHVVVGLLTVVWTVVMWAKPVRKGVGWFKCRAGW